MPKLYLSRLWRSKKKLLNPNNPDLVPTLNSLGTVYVSQHKYVEAEGVYKQALAICEKSLGADSLGTATALNNLAGVFAQEGKNSDAQPLATRALKIREKSLGANHPLVADSLENCASLCRKMGHEANACQMEPCKGNTSEQQGCQINNTSSIREQRLVMGYQGAPVKSITRIILMDTLSGKRGR